MSTIVLTGVARRGQLGEAIARHLATLGHPVVLLDRDGDEAGQRAAELRRDGLEATGIGVDLTDPAALGAVAAQVADAAPRGLSALVNTAGGFGPTGALDESDPATFHRLLAVNLGTAFMTTRAFLPLLRQARGAVVYFASAAALPDGDPSGLAAYVAAKSAVLGLARSVAADEVVHGVRANAVALTSVRTAANVSAMGAEARYVERESVAAVVAWLCSEQARDVTGQVLRVGV